MLPPSLAAIQFCVDASPYVMQSLYRLSNHLYLLNRHYVKWAYK